MKRELRDLIIMIRINDNIYSYIKDLAKKYDTTISNMTRILIFANYNYFDSFLNNKKNNFVNEEETTIYKKRISIFLKKNEFDFLKKLSKALEQKISTVIPFINFNNKKN